MLDAALLTPVDAAQDPLASHRPARVECSPAAWGPEGGGFEVQTGVCNYASFDQPLPMELRAGDALNITIWHDLLDAAEPGEAHVAIWMGREVLWEAEVSIPAPSASLEARVVLETAPPPGARLGLHLHNHGFNSWRFVGIDVHQR